ncbi:MAG TPA: hypothetical protein VLH59_08525 [Ignavibacteriaceae bacterium]|nr:hypothetical protein [Ignavibacteriaceae bacterium]
MEIDPDNNYHKVALLNRIRIILVLLVRIPLPILAVLIILQIFILRYASALKLNTDIFFYPLILIVGAAVLSTPFLFYVLIKEKRWAWIIIFVVMVVLPCLFYYSISFGYFFTIFGMTVVMIPFYLYFLLLRYTVGEWLAEYEGQEMRKERKREEARRLKEEEEWI